VVAAGKAQQGGRGADQGALGAENEHRGVLLVDDDEGLVVVVA
jgi:hypothetical protein